MATVAKNSRSTTSTLASATAGPFDVGFRLFDDDALLVYVNGVSRADWTLSSTYLAGYDDDATITFDDALAISDELRIEGWLSPARSADYVNGDPDLAGKMNVELARLWSSVIEVKREVSRALRGFDDLSPVDGVDLETVAAAETYATAASASATAAAASEAAALAAENSLLEWQGAWLTATAYAPSDLVQDNGNTYVCLVAHTSGTFSTDLAALKWELFAAKGASGAGSGDVVAANNGTEFTASTFAANLSLVQTSRAISAGTGLTGGGNLSADRSIAADIASQAEAEAGSSSTKLMTPQRVAQAIAAQVDVGAGWAPYDGSTGVIYDFSVDGAVSEIVTPDFEDGYEYLLRFEDISGATSTNWQMQLYQETSAAYSVLQTILATGGSGGIFHGDIHIKAPRAVSKHHDVAIQYGSNSGTGFQSGTRVILTQYHSTAQAILRARAAMQGSNTDGGKMVMYRRPASFE